MAFVNAPSGLSYRLVEMALKAEDYSFEVSFFESLHKRLPMDFRVVSVLAHLYTRVGRYDCGLKMDRKLVRLEPEDPLVHYNLACSLALKERKRDAVAALEEALRLGYKDHDWMRKDPDLAGLRDYPPFRSLLDAAG